MSKSRFGSFELPTISSSSLGNELLQPVNSTVQSTLDYSLPSITQRVSEAATQLFSTGQTGGFNKVSSKVGLEKTPGATAITDAMTGDQLLSVPLGGSFITDLPETPSPSTSDFKVKLTTMNFGSIVLDVMPSIDEGQGAEYVEFNPMHHPGAILKYRRTTARTWSIQAKLIARNATEAKANLTTINMIRGWVMPQYGIRTANNPGAVLGAPPPIITLSAYGNRVIGPVKCVLENFRWSFANDVDYLPTVDINVRDARAADQAPFPAIIDITLALKESWSPAEFSNFDLQAYINGRLSGPDGAFFAQRVERTQRNTAEAPPGPSSQDNFIAGSNALRRLEVSEPKEVDQTRFIKGSNDLRRFENNPVNSTPAPNVGPGGFE